MLAPGIDQVLKGFAIGFGIAAPVGPIGLLCLRRSLAFGRTAGFVAGLGAATADAVYGSIAAFGLTAIARALLEYRTVLSLSGGLFLVGLGLSTARTKPATASASTPSSLTGGYASTFALTLANPATILSFLGIFAGVGFVRSAGLASAASLVAGVFLGSATWWLILSTGAHWLGTRLASERLRLVNIASGALLAAFGLWQLFRLL